MEKVYFLFGLNCTGIYESKGFEELVNEIVNNGCYHNEFCFAIGETRPEALLNMYDGYEGFSVISEEEYFKLILL